LFDEVRIIFYSPIFESGLGVMKTLHILSGLRLLAIADVDNLAISARRVLHSSVNPCSLWNSIRRDVCRLTATAVLTTKPELRFTTEEWSKGGWKVVPVFREHVHTIRGEEHLANADLNIAFEAAVLTAGHPHADGILLLTGDGNLASSIARDVRRCRPSMRVFAAAVPGTASSRLRDQTLFDGFIPLDRELACGPALAA